MKLIIIATIVVLIVLLFRCCPSIETMVSGSGDTKHPYVGLKAETNRLSTYEAKGKISKVYHQDGYIYELEVDTGKKKIKQPFYAWYIEGQLRLIEDFNYISPQTRKIKKYFGSKGLGRPRMYYSQYWEGLERLYLLLAHASEKAQIKYAGHYSYDSGQIGKNWKIILPDTDIHCHTLSHNLGWSLQTNIMDRFDKSQNQNQKWIYHGDPWIRSMLWTMETIRQVDPLGQTRQIEHRLQLHNQFRTLVDDLVNEVFKAYNIYYKNPPPTPTISIVINGWALPLEKHIDYVPTRHIDDLDISLPYGLLLLHLDTKSFEVPKVNKKQLVHYIIHAFRDEKCNKINDSHHDFKRISKIVL